MLFFQLLQIFGIFIIVGGAEIACSRESQGDCCWCPCTELYVPNEYSFDCDVRCLDFFKDTDANFDKVCTVNSTRCKSSVCINSKCEEKCVYPSKQFECDQGCKEWCGLELSEECAAQGCTNFGGMCWDTNEPVGLSIRVKNTMQNQKKNAANDPDAFGDNPDSAAESFLGQIDKQIESDDIKQRRLGAGGDDQSRKDKVMLVLIMLAFIRMCDSFLELIIWIRRHEDEIRAWINL